MGGLRNRGIVIAALAGAVLGGPLLLLWASTGSSGNFGYYAYEPLSGAVYTPHFFNGRAFSSAGDLYLARAEVFGVGAAAGALIGIAVWVVLHVRSAGVVSTGALSRGARASVAAGGGVLVGLLTVLFLHFDRNEPVVVRAVRIADYGPPSLAHPHWWPSVIVVPLGGALCGLALGLLAGNEKRSITTTE